MIAVASGANTTPGPDERHRDGARWRFARRPVTSSSSGARSRRSHARTPAKLGRGAGASRRVQPGARRPGVDTARGVRARRRWLTVNRLELAVIVAGRRPPVSAPGPRARSAGRSAARTLLERNAPSGVGVARAVVVTLERRAARWWSPASGAADRLPARGGTRPSTRSARATRSPARWRRSLAAGHDIVGAAHRAIAAAMRSRPAEPVAAPGHAKIGRGAGGASPVPDGGRSARGQLKSPTVRATGPVGSIRGPAPAARSAGPARSAARNGGSPSGRARSSRPSRRQPVRDVQPQQRRPDPDRRPRAAPAPEAGPSAAGRSPPASRASRRRG